jgi:hypothetical protein
MQPQTRSAERRRIPAEMSAFMEIMFGFMRDKPYRCREWCSCSRQSDDTFKHPITLPKAPRSHKTARAGINRVIMIGMIISFTLDSGLSGEGHGVSWGMEGLLVAIAAILLGITAWATRFLDRERIVTTLP